MGQLQPYRSHLNYDLPLELCRLLVQVLKCKNGQYKLQSQHGRLAGRFQGGALNSIEPSISDLLGNSIRTEPEKKGGKEVTIKFPAAVAKENNRGSINSAQKAGRTAKIAPKPHGKPGPKLHGKPGPKPRGKPGPKPSTKRKRAEIIAIRDNGEVGDGEAGELSLAPKLGGKPGPKSGTKRKWTETEVRTPSPWKLRKRA
jgi:hypothetical protein